ncbi:hypothetical protein EDB19DRAFT_2046016 [Suillus lakei]|nr:hypothetical protein EDB19DRAFT_2046016 [Suillus lakei]
MDCPSNQQNQDPPQSAMPLHMQQRMGNPNMRAPTPKVPTLTELIQRREKQQSDINNMEQHIRTVLAQTGGVLDEAWTAKLGQMHADIHKRKTAFLRLNQVIQSGGILPPRQAQFAHAVSVIENTKQVFSSRGLPRMQTCTVPPEQRIEYNQLLDQLEKMTRDLDGRLPMYWIVLGSDDTIRRLVAIVLMVAHQRVRFLTGSPQVLIGLRILKSMYNQVQKANEEFEQRLQTMKAVHASRQMVTAHAPQILQPPPPIGRHPSTNQSHPPSHPQPSQPIVNTPLSLPKWKARLDKWSDKIRAETNDVISFLIVSCIASLTLHWVVNVICPHVGIGIVPICISILLGIFGVTVIHMTIGGDLEMTSAAVFHLISWRNFFSLSAVVVGVLIPVGLHHYFKHEIASVADVAQGGLEEELSEDSEAHILVVDPGAASLVELSDEEM